MSLDTNGFGQQYWENKWPKNTVVYGGRTLPSKTEVVGIDVTQFIANHDSILQQIVEQFSLKKATLNDTALAVQAFVAKYVTYLDDQKNTSTPEYWQFPFETIQSGSGDCEDGAILMANLMINAGIPSWRVKVAAGYVQEAPTAPQGGHCYCMYLADRPEQEKQAGWVVMDWCIVDNKNTKIQTPEGSRRISKLKEGDWIIGYNEEENKPELTQIKSIGNRKAKNIFKITFEKQSPIYATGEHPFFVNGEWVATENLKEGMEPYFIQPRSLFHSFHDHKKDAWRAESHKKLTEKLKLDGHYERLRARQTGGTNIAKKQSARDKISKNNGMKRAEILEKVYQSRQDRTKKTFVERSFIEYCDENNLPAKFTGDFSYWIRTSEGSKNPDFIIPGEKKIIEVSCEYMEKFRNWENYKEERSKLLAEKGYKSLFVLYNDRGTEILEPKDTSEINSFIMNGNKIVKIEPISSSDTTFSKENGKTVWNMHCEPHNNYFVNGTLVHNCYFEDSKTPVAQKPLAKDGGYKGCYKDVWFTFNGDWCWSGGEIAVFDGRISTKQNVVLEQISKSKANIVTKLITKIRRKIPK